MNYENFTMLLVSVILNWNKFTLFVTKRHSLPSAKQNIGMNFDQVFRVPSSHNLWVTTHKSQSHFRGNSTEVERGRRQWTRGACQRTWSFGSRQSLSWFWLRCCLRQVCTKILLFREIWKLDQTGRKFCIFNCVEIVLLL